MRCVFGAQVIAVVGHFFAAVIREIVTAVITFPACNVGANNDTIAGTQRNALEIGVSSVTANGLNDSDIFMTLNDWKFHAAVAVLRGIALESVFVSAANARHEHFHEYAAWSRLG